MTEIAKFVWVLFIVAFFVGMKAFIICLIIFVFILFLYRLNPKWFEPK